MIKITLMLSSNGICRMNQGYKLLLFDFDGTLVDTAHDIIFYANTVLRPG